MTEPTVTVEVEAREVSPWPTEPDAQGVYPSGLEATGRGWWHCTCGETSWLKPTADAYAEARAHAEAHGIAV